MPGGEPAPPLADGVDRDAKVSGDHGVRVLRRSSQHDPGSEDITLLRPGPGDPRLQDLPLTSGQPDRFRDRRARCVAGTRGWGTDGIGGSSHGSVVPAPAAVPQQVPGDTPPHAYLIVPSVVPDGKMTTMVKVPDSTKSSLEWKLRARAKDRWPDLQGVSVKHRAGFAYVTGHLSDGEALPLCRLRYVGSASRWGFAIYRASHDDYEQCFLPTSSLTGTPEEALDTACGLYLGDPTAWITPPTN